MFKRFLLSIPFCIGLYVYFQTNNKIFGCTFVWYMILAKYLEDKTTKIKDYLIVAFMCLLFTIMVLFN